jgi:predicted PurR-regulated permease PerM
VLWQLAQVLLVIFAAVLLAVLLDGVARVIEYALPFGRALALALGLLLMIGANTALMMLAGPQIGAQVAQLAEQLPEAIDNLEDRIEDTSWGRTALDLMPKPEAMMPSAGNLMAGISGVFSTTLGAFLNTLIVLIVGIYLAVNPCLYVRGTLLLLPPEQRTRGAGVLRALGHALRWWLVGRIASMTAVGLLTGAGLWLIGAPVPLALGLIAGIFSFVPMIGPVLAAIPALLIVLMQDPMQVLYVALVYWVAQILEGNVITPLIQQRTVALAPAMLISAQLLVTVLFGFMGLVMATPLAVVVLVLVQMLYVRDVLHSEVRVLGEH